MYLILYLILYQVLRNASYLSCPKGSQGLPRSTFAKIQEVARTPHFFLQKRKSLFVYERTPLMLKNHHYPCVLQAQMWAVHSHPQRVHQ